MARLLAAWELGSGLGHVGPLAGAARGLAALGHRTWLAARDVTTPATLPDQPFAGTLQAPVWHGLRLSAPAVTLGQIYTDAGFADDDGQVALVGAWLSLFALAHADAVYTEHAPAALLAAHVARLPAARLGTPFTCPPATRPMPALALGVPTTPAARAHADALADRVVRSVCRHFGAPPLDGLAELLATAPPFVLSWPELDPAAGRQDSRYYGPLGGIGARQLPTWPDRPGPRVFVYLPFERVMARALAEALGRRGWPVIWVCTTPPPFALPANIAHEAEPLDLGATLAQAWLCVHRGGHGLALDALRAGCPQLLLPDRQEARCHALQLAAHGLAHLPAAWDAATIGDALDSLALPQAPERAAARAMAARHADYAPDAAAHALAVDLARALRLD